MIHFVKDYQTALYYCMTCRMGDEVIYQLDTFTMGLTTTVEYEIVPSGDRDENSAAVIKKAILEDGSEIIIDSEWGIEYECLEQFLDLQHQCYIKAGQIL